MLAASCRAQTGAHLPVAVLLGLVHLATSCLAPPAMGHVPEQLSRPAHQRLSLPRMLYCLGLALHGCVPAPTASSFSQPPEPAGATGSQKGMRSCSIARNEDAMSLPTSGISAGTGRKCRDHSQAHSPLALGSEQCLLHGLQLVLQVMKALAEPVLASCSIL